MAPLTGGARTTSGLPLAAWARALVASASVIGAAAPAGIAATIRVPADAPTVAAALAAAAPSDTVAVSPGTYFERVALPSAVTLRAEGAPGSVVLDGAAGGSVVTCVNPGAGTRIEGLVLRGGSGELDGDVRLGGGLLVQGGRLELADLRIEGGTADFGGGLFADGAEIEWARGALTGNTGVFGGGWFARRGRMRLEGVEIRDNTAEAGGGGYGTGLAGVEIVSCLCRGNQALGDGGALHLSASGVAISDSRFAANSAGADGGALRLGSGTSATLSYVVLVDNVAQGNGGGAHVSCEGPAGPSCSELRLFHADVVANRAPGSGAASAAGAAAIRVQGSLIAGNEGGIACLSPQAVIEVACTALFANDTSPPLDPCSSTYADTLMADPRLCDRSVEGLRRCSNSPLLTPPACGLPFLGAQGEGCAPCGPTAATVTTWGGLKARYR